MQIPIVNVSSLFANIHEEGSSDLRIETAKGLLSAFEEVGLAYLCFNGPSAKLLQENVSPAFKKAKQFFARPIEEKDSAKVDGLPQGVTRGYLGTGAESGADHFELKEAFSWSYSWDKAEHAPQNRLEARNVWPSSQSTKDGSDSDMKKQFETLFKFMCEVMLTLIDAVAEVWPRDYKDLPDLHTLCKQGASISLLRAFHYHGTENIRPGMTGSCEHTDWGFATLIAQDADSANTLQVFLDEAWHDVPPLPGTLLVNCSDFLSMLTNGRLRSPLHRVILTKQERFSFVFFQYPGFNTPVPKLSAEGLLKTAGLSLLKNQGRQLNPSQQGETGRGVTGMSFGEFIAMKWQQVSRS